MLIAGKLRQIERVQVKAPNDGVHATSVKTGFLKGTHCCYMGDKLVPKGQVSLYWQKDELSGVKVYYSLNGHYACKHKYVKTIFHKMRKLSKLGVSPRPDKIVSVDLDVAYKGKKVKRTVLGIKVDHVDYPVEAWTKFAHGHPYDFNCLDQTEHPDHNPDGFKRFKEHLKKVMKKNGITTSGSYKLGDIVYCQRTKRWLYLDIDI